MNHAAADLKTLNETCARMLAIIDDK